eukprot:3826140-Pleurochrysis_carterae.AAC.2
MPTARARRAESEGVPRLPEEGNVCARESRRAHSTTGLRARRRVGMRRMTTQHVQRQAQRPRQTRGSCRGGRVSEATRRQDAAVNWIHDGTRGAASCVDAREGKRRRPRTGHDRLLVWAHGHLRAARSGREGRTRGR